MIDLKILQQAKYGPLIIELLNKKLIYENLYYTGNATLFSNKNTDTNDYRCKYGFIIDGVNIYCSIKLNFSVPDYFTLCNTSKFINLDYVPIEIKRSILFNIDIFSNPN